LITYVEHFTDPRRRQALIVDDSLFKREFSNNTEILARVFDHNKQTYFKGLRALTVGWSDGNTFLPVNFALMSSSNKKNQLAFLSSLINDHWPIRDALKLCGRRTMLH
jgi:hypothetical protein